MNCKKYRIKKYVNRNGVIYYIVQRKVLGLFWRGMFRAREYYDDIRTIPRVYYKEEEAIKDLKDYIRIESERVAAYKAGKAKIKGNEYICIE